MAALFGIGLVLDYYMWFLEAAFSGAGRGISSPIVVVNGPLGIFVLLWPFLIMGANAPWFSLRPSAKLTTCVYYGWLPFRIGSFENMQFEYSKMEHAKSLFDLWMFFILVVIVHGLIWLPVPLIKFYQRATRGHSPPRPGEGS